MTASPILDAEMSLLHRLALRVGLGLAHDPQARAKAGQVLNDDIKPRAKRAWRDAQPGIERAKRKVIDVAKNVRDEYRKGRDGE